MELYNRVTGTLIWLIWSEVTFAILLGLGLLFTIWSRFIQYRALTHGVQVLRGKYDDKNDPGAINHFQALSAALSGTVGLGNIGGVALAIGIGGPGALFWMWMTGFFGMAIKAVEVTLALMYRDTTDPNNPHGGAMYVITRGWGDRVGGIARPIGKLVGGLFCVTLLIATVTGGNMFQAWNVADITNEYFGVPQIVCGIIMSVVTGLVIIGGIKRIGDVAGYLVPFMCGMYLVSGIIVLFVRSADVPGYLALIVREAFSPTEAGGAFLGASAWFGLSIGLRRALFSNEAGQGTSPIAHSAAKTDEPVREGIVAGLEPFIDTCLVCTLTALVILCTGTWNRKPVGEFRGEIALARGTGGNTWTVEAPTDIANLPELHSPDSWEVGNGFFLIARAPGGVHEDRRSDFVRVQGKIAATGAANAEGIPDGTKRIEWQPVTLSSEEWETPPDGDLVLVDRGIHRDLVGAALTGHAYDRAIPGLGKYMVTITCWLFAISTLISWSYYGEQGTIFLFGAWAVPFYKVIYCLLTIVATIPAFITSDADLEALSDLGTGLMLAANVPIILALGHRAIGAFDDYFRRLRSGEITPPHDAPRISDLIEGRDVE